MDSEERNARPVVWEQHRGPLLAAINSHKVIACESCGFAHVVPLPTPEALAQEYRERYYTEEKPAYLAHAGEDQDWARLSQQDRLEVLHALLPAHRRHLLDIGCGPGFFVETAKRSGWKAEGLEPSRQAASHARNLGLIIHEGFFDDAMAAKLGRFDVIQMNNMLEHVPDPQAVIARAIGLLEPGGVLCAGVPNDFSPLQRAAHRQGLPQWWVAPPHHLNYFDFTSLAALLEQQGLKIVSRQTSFPMEMFLLMGDDYTRDPALGRACHQKRKRFDLALAGAGLDDVRQAFYGALAQAGLGREAVLFAQKA